MKRLIASALILAASASAADLDAVLVEAGHAWGVSTETYSITAAPLTKHCIPLGVMPLVAWSDFANRVIVINSACHLSARRLLDTVTHEVGHLIASTPNHSEDPHSIMHRWISHGQTITADDRAARGI